MKTTIILSLLLHGAIFLSLRFDWSLAKLKPSVALETQVVFKAKPKSKELLPNKPKPEAAATKMAEQKIPAPKPMKVESEKARPAPKKENISYGKKLASLSKSFAADLAADEEEEVLAPSESTNDASYFDTMYTLIKESFVVPPHLFGPKGESLQTVLRIFLSASGHLIKIELETSSGDEQFDKAVMDGTRRVNNFGQVPLFLQEMLQKRGVAVELCPIKCK